MRCHFDHPHLLAKMVPCTLLTGEAIGHSEALIPTETAQVRRGPRRDQRDQKTREVPSRFLAATDVEPLPQTCQLSHPVADLVRDTAEVVETGLFYRQAATVRSSVITDPP